MFLRPTSPRCSLSFPSLLACTPHDICKRASTDTTTPEVGLFKDWADCMKNNIRKNTQVIPALVAQGYEVYALDFLGHGLSDKPVDPRLISFQLHVRTLREFFTRFDVPRDCILVGHDWGGCIALSAAPTLPLIRPRIFCLNTFFAPRPSDIRLHYYLLYILWFLSTGIFDGFLPEWAIMRYMAPSPTTTADVVRGYGAPFSPTSSFSSFTYSQAALSSGNAGESEFEIRTGPGPGPGPGESESERDRRGFGFFHHHHYRIFRLPAPVAAWINYMQTYFSALRTHARLLSMSKSSVGRFAHMVPGFSDIFLFNARSTRAFRLLEGLLGPQRVFFSNLAAQALLARDDRLVRAFWRRVGQGSTDGGGVRRAFGTGDDDEENVRVRDNGVHATGSSRDAALNTRSTRRRTTGESSGAASWKATVVFGADDPLLRDFKSVLEDTIEKSALVSVSGDGWIAGAGHYPVEEKPEVVANLICEFAERSRR
ncbi:alpha/beta-hydrolase [Xylona heveae TC161]|uniref:Alpha/beta-hydrolase n=1 Tax=Xylona heveae (strain CBS 132557 / TC161) TaxID=1328760 RepID=A0A165G689_XYLHT|nr:alpha/beta-hydrolase [Xylona heveae TC161]KZF21787.1 alpha/beta-hydrolase [Xylona heveae TC161]